MQGFFSHLIRPRHHEFFTETFNVRERIGFVEKIGFDRTGADGGHHDSPRLHFIAQRPGERTMDTNDYIREDVASIRRLASGDPDARQIYDKLADDRLVRHAANAMQEKLQLARVPTRVRRPLKGET